MLRGDDRDLSIQPFDRRGSFRISMFGRKVPLTEPQTAQIAAARRGIFDGFKTAIANEVSRAKAGILMDEAAILRDARATGFTTAFPTEKSGQAAFDFEYGENFTRLIGAFGPTFCEVPVSYSPEENCALNQTQAARRCREFAAISENSRSVTVAA
jgi:hypothetical protein